MGCLALALRSTRPTGSRGASRPNAAEGRYAGSVPSGSDEHSLPRLLQEARPLLERLVVNEARPLLRLETEEDLVQGICAHALSVADRFEYRSEAEFRAWIRTIARQHLVNRSRYWSARRRDGVQVLRLTQVGSRTSAQGDTGLAGSRTGPLTFAARREQLALAAKVIAVLSDRDRALLRSLGDGTPLEEMSVRLGITYETAKKARQRALDRFRITYDLLLKN